jgi:hypothetical protein
MVEEIKKIVPNKFKLNIIHGDIVLVRESTKPLKKLKYFHKNIGKISEKNKMYLKKLTGQAINFKEANLLT